MPNFMKLMFILVGVLLFDLNSAYAEIITLKSGETVEGELIEKTDKYIKIDFQGVPVTYFLDEIKSSDEEVTITIKPEAEKFYENGANLVSEGRYSEAVEECQKAIEIDPKFPFTYINLGSAYNFLKQYSDAVAVFNKVIELYPDLALAYGNLGKSYYYLDQADDAVMALKKAVELDPNYVEAYTRLSLVYLNSSNFEEAINYSKKSITIRPSAEAYGNLGLAYKVTGQMQLAMDNLLKAKELFIKDGNMKAAERIEQDLKNP